MKTKFFLVVLVSLLSFSTVEARSKGGTEIRVTKDATPEEAQRARELQQRIDEIEAIDVRELTREEKQELKQELKDIKREARQMDNVYIYFGGGFLLLLLLLIILI